jgi:hypothetical protein
MAMLAQAVGGSAIFCFHDENFLLPRPADSLARVAAMRKTLDEQGVGPSAFVGKCRPDTVTKELARELARLGVMRMYVGVENASPSGALHLNRRTDVASMAAALDAFAAAGIFTCYNLLLFEPQATLDDVAMNISFMREHAVHPINFCRAEPYLGTPMHQHLQAAGKLRGGFLGWDYRIDDDRTELMFRIAASAFRERNFAADGAANRYMALGYTAKILDVFYKDSGGRCASFMERAQEITRSLTLDSAELLEQALDIAAKADLGNHDQIARLTARLGLRVAASDRVWHAAMDALERDMATFARGESQSVRKTVSRTAKVAQGAAMAGWLALWAAGGTSCGANPSDPLPPDKGAFDARKNSADVPDGSLVVDPLPPPADARDGTSNRDTFLPDSGTKQDAYLVVDMARRDSGARLDVAVADPLPPDSGARLDVFVADPPPPDAGPRDVRGDSVQSIDGGSSEVGTPDFAAERPLVVDMGPRGCRCRRDCSTSAQSWRGGRPGCCRQRAALHARSCGRFEMGAANAARRSGHRQRPQLVSTGRIPRRRA